MKIKKRFLSAGDETEESGLSSCVPLFVSIYLVVLAFFILLNSIATIHPEHTAAAVGSIRNTFSNIDSAKEIPIIKVASPAGGEISLRNYIAPIGKIARGAVTLVEASIIEYGNTMRITMPAETFFGKDEAYIRPEHDDFLSSLAEELMKIEAGSKTNVEFVIGSSELTDYPKASNSLELARAVSFADTMTKMGVSPGSISSGVTAGLNKNKISITFIETAAEEVAPKDKDSDDK